jgi:hypothetical protein
VKRFEVYNADRLVAVGVEFDEESGSDARPVALLPLGEPTPVVAPGGIDSVPMMFVGHVVKILDGGSPEPRKRGKRKSE